VLVGILHAVSFGLLTMITQWFFDSVSDAAAGRISAMIAYGSAVGLIAAVIGIEVINGLYNFMSNQFFKKLTGHLSLRLNAKASQIDPISFENPALLNDITKAREGMMSSLDLVFTTITMALFYVPFFGFLEAYMFSLQPVLALSLVLIFVPVLITQLIRGKIAARLADESAPVRREYEYYERCIVDREFFKETRILGAFTFFRELYRSSLTLLGKKIWQSGFRTGMLELGMRTITLAGYLGVLALLFNALLSGDISIGAFAAVFSAVGLMFSVMEEMIGMHMARMNTNLATVRNYFRFMELPERGGKDSPLQAGCGIRLQNVSFAYPGADNKALTNVSLEMKEGETIAIVGENGAGKSTLVKLMTGLYLPTEGTVTIGGLDTREVSGASIYRGISAVFQKYQRYKMTLRDNIRISDMPEQTGRGEHKADFRLAEAAEKANLSVAADTFPAGYDTMLAREFEGVDLSGGQWQRVAIARGFYRAHGMIVLDEPTAAIDPLEETRIYQQFAELSRNKTSIIVTHRLGSARIADRIVVMDRGQICEIGTHDELMRAGSKYAEMFQAQSQWYVSDYMLQKE
jgi:ATP-binding cassette subfamily B protein